jgi:hypothetical protein
MMKIKFPAVAEEPKRAVLGWRPQQQQWRAQAVAQQQEQQLQWRAAERAWTLDEAPRGGHGGQACVEALGVRRERRQEGQQPPAWHAVPLEKRARWVDAPLAPTPEPGAVEAAWPEQQASDAHAREAERPTKAPRAAQPVLLDAAVCDQPEWAARVAADAGGADVTTAAGAEQVRKAVEKAHRKPRRAAMDFADEDEASETAIAGEVACLVPLLPRAVVTSVLDGERGLQQVADPARRAQQLGRRLRARAGSEGARIRTLRTFLQAARAHALITMRCTLDACDEAIFPMAESLVHEIIWDEHQRALQAGRGSKGGATKGNGVREAALFAVKMGWPMRATKDGLAGAAPPATASARTRAGVLPIAAKCQLEAQARGEHMDDLSVEARAVAQFYARSLLAGGVDQSVRVQEGVRVYLMPDEHEPLTVMRGRASMGKDGAPIDLYAPAEGFTGPYTWYREHIEDVLRLGQVFPAWVKPRGSKGVLGKAAGLKTTVAPKGDIRAALKALLQRAPLAYTDAEMASMNLQGHSLHASPPEWARTIGEWPQWCAPRAQLTSGLAHGFSESDTNALGHWLRDAGAKQTAAAAHAATMAAPALARREAAIASLPGNRSTRGNMNVYYGQAGTGGQRVSERMLQLRVRQRLVHTVRAALNGRDWRDLPRGIDDLSILESDDIQPDGSG